MITIIIRDSSTGTNVASWTYISEILPMLRATIPLFDTPDESDELYLPASLVSADTVRYIILVLTGKLPQETILSEQTALYIPYSVRDYLRLSAPLEQQDGTIHPAWKRLVSYWLDHGTVEELGEGIEDVYYYLNSKYRELMLIYQSRVPNHKVLGYDFDVGMSCDTSIEKMMAQSVSKGKDLDNDILPSVRLQYSPNTKIFTITVEKKSITLPGCEGVICCRCEGEVFVCLRIKDRLITFSSKHLLNKLRVEQSMAERDTCMKLQEMKDILTNIIPLL